MLEEVKTRIPMHCLSSTVTDAFEAIRCLGQRYLSVDALCIVQDSDEDMTQEISRMGAIYKSATVTITAATAREASEGFLQRRWLTPRSAAVRMRLPMARPPLGHAGLVSAGTPSIAAAACLF